MLSDDELSSLLKQSEPRQTTTVPDDVLVDVLCATPVSRPRHYGRTACLVGLAMAASVLAMVVIRPSSPTQSPAPNSQQISLDTTIDQREIMALENEIKLLLATSKSDSPNIITGQRQSEIRAKASLQMLSEILPEEKTYYTNLSNQLYPE